MTQTGVRTETNALAAFESLSEAEWQTVIPNEERTVGVLVHHVADACPILERDIRS